MIEKVNPSHPDKLADRIAGAIVDLAYEQKKDPTIAVEVMLGHGNCHIIAETNTKLDKGEIEKIIKRICKSDQIKADIQIVNQDVYLLDNQKNGFHCGDNGIFKGVPLSDEQKELSRIAHTIYDVYPSDGKYILDDGKLIICQSCASKEELEQKYPKAYVNPIGDWSGGIEVDTGATNRKLGSDMADSVTGGGLHGKDLSKADVSVNIHAFLKAQREHKTIELSCAIGDDTIDGLPYEEIVEEARNYIRSVGGFEKFAEWGLY